MKKYKMAGIIKNGQIKYLRASADGEKRYYDFLSKNEGKSIETIIEVNEGIKYWMHKYYRGYLLPDITAAMGEVSQKRIHIFLKWEFNGIKCEKIEDIPGYVTRDQLVIQNGKLLGYVKSMSKFKLEEAKEFLKFCEYRLFQDFQSYIGVSANNFEEHQKEAHKIRQRIF